MKAWKTIVLFAGLSMMFCSCTVQKTPAESAVPQERIGIPLPNPTTEVIRWDFDSPKEILESSQMQDVVCSNGIITAKTGYNPILVLAFNEGALPFDATKYSFLTVRLYSSLAAKPMRIYYKNTVNEWAIAGSFPVVKGWATYKINLNRLDWSIDDNSGPGAARWGGTSQKITTFRVDPGMLESEREVRFDSIEFSSDTGQAVGVVQNVESAGANMVRNGDMEIGTVGAIPQDWLRNGKITTDNPHGGKYCAVQTANPSNGWNMFDTVDKAYIPVKQNQTYRLTAWSRNTVPSGTIGLGIHMVPLEKEGSGGSYQWKTVNCNIQTWQKYSLVFKTADDTKLAGVYLKLGEDAAAGEVWWDDVSLVEAEEVISWFTGALNDDGVFFTDTVSPGKSTLLPKTYWDQNKGDFYKAPAISNVAFTVNFGKDPAGKNITLSICKRYEPEVVLTKNTVPLHAGQKTISLNVPVEQLKPGRYTATVALANAQDVLERTTFPLAIIPRPDYPTKLEDIKTTGYDADRRVLVNGKPFVGFQIACHGGLPVHYRFLTDNFGENLRGAAVEVARTGSKAVAENIEEVRTHLDDMRVTGSYGEVTLFHPWILDEQSHTFRTEVLKQVVLGLKDHPALFMWTLMDEPENLHVAPAEMIRAYKLVKELDPNHLVWQNLCNPATFKDYIAAGDFASYDHYPFPVEPLTIIDSWNKMIMDIADNRKPLVSYLQCWNMQGMRNPTLAEMRAQTWLCVSRGMQLFEWFAWNLQGAGLANFLDLWGGVREIQAELFAARDFLCATNETVSLPVLRVDAVRYCLRTVGKQKYLLVVNMLDEPIAPYTITLPGFSEGKVEVLFEDERPLEVQGASLTDRLDNYGVHLYRYASR